MTKPLPGTQPGGLPTPGDRDDVNASGALVSLFRHWDQLTADQQAAVADFFLPDDPSTIGTLPAAAHRAPTQETYLAAIGSAFAEADAVLQGVFGPRRFDLNYFIAGDGEMAASLAAATSVTPRFAPFPVGDEVCFSQWNPTFALRGDTLIRSIAAHELLHCYAQDVHYPDIEAVFAMPEWVAEGVPAWFGEHHVGGTDFSAGWWEQWLTRPERLLRARSYDAIGFWSLVEADGVGLMPLLPELFRNASAALDTAFAAAPDRVHLNDRWAAAYRRQSGAGAEFDTFGPGVTGDRPDADDLGGLSSDGPTAGRRLEARTARVFTADVRSDVLRVQSQINGGFVGPRGAHALISQVNGRELCLRSDGCECPADSGGGRIGEGLPAFDQGDFAFAFGGEQVGEFTLTPLSLESVCEDRDPTTTTVPGCGAAGTSGLRAPAVRVPQQECAPGVDPCLVGTWVSAGFQLPPDAGTATGGTGIRAVFRPDGTLRLDHAGARLLLTGGPEGIVVETTAVYGGADEGTWTAAGGQLATTFTDLRVFTVDITSVVNGVVVSELHETAASLGGSVASGGTYTCGPDGWTLTITAPGGGEAFVTVQFVRG